MYILAAILLLGVLTLLFDDALDQQRNPNMQPQSYSDGDGRQSIVLQRNRAGHYVVSGTINGEPVEFLLDTGATDVAVPAPLAERLGLPRLARVRVMTANGYATAYSTRIASLSIGTIVESDLPATIVTNMPGDGVLLGMSLLKRLDFAQRGDTLILTQRPNS